MLYGGAELDCSGWYLALFISLGLMVLLVRFLLWACWDWFLLGCPITWLGSNWILRGNRLG